MTQDSCLGFLSGPQPSREASALRPSAGKRLTVTIVPCHALSAEPKDVVSFNSAASARVSVAVLLQSRAATAGLQPGEALGRGLGRSLVCLGTWSGAKTQEGICCSKIASQPEVVSFASTKSRLVLKVAGADPGWSNAMLALDIRVTW